MVFLLSFGSRFMLRGPPSALLAVHVHYDLRTPFGNGRQPWADVNMMPAAKSGWEHSAPQTVRSACKGGTPSVAISMPSLQNGKPSSIAVTI